MSGFNWVTTRFDLPEHFAFVAYNEGASVAPVGKPWGAYVASSEDKDRDYSWHATADEAKAAAIEQIRRDGGRP